MRYAPCALRLLPQVPPCGTLLKFTPPAQLNVFDFLFNRGGMFTPLNLKDIQLGPLTIPLGRSAPFALCRMKLVLRLDVGRWSRILRVWEIVKNNDLGRRLLLSEKSCIYCNKSCIYCNRMLVIVKLFNVNPNVAKVEGAADPRRQRCSCSNLPQALDNAGDAVPSAFP